MAEFLRTIPPNGISPIRVDYVFTSICYIILMCRLVFFHVLYFTFNVLTRWQALPTKSIAEPCEERNLLNSAGMDIPQMEPQSGVIDSSQQITEQQSTVKFTVGGDDTMQKLSVDLTDRCTTMDPEVEFSKFFERPVEIGKVSWQVNTPLDFIVNPWEAWMDNVRVGNRLSNFANFAGNLHIKLVINGNPFYWGGAQLSYMPGAFDRTLNLPWYNTNSNYYGDKMSASQRLKIFVDPTLSQGGEMILPFTWEFDMFNMVFDNPEDLGQLWLNDLGTLRHPSLTDAIDITIYAWCENVQLSAPTRGNISGLQPQAGEVDEFQQGPIEKKAAIVSKVAGALKDVPIIGKYAMASKIGADVVGKGAHALGISRPRQVENVVPYRLSQTGDLATVDAFDTSQSLAFNAKREVTIDPTLTGGHTDEMSFEFFRNRESLIGTFDWIPARAPNDILYSVPVQPMQAFAAPRTFPASTLGITTTPTSMVAMPFEYWRGGLRFRIQVMSSSFHKGRLLLVWDPAGFGGPPEVQVQRSIVLDISDSRTYTYDIGWGSEKPALEVGPVNNFSLPIATTWSTVGAVPKTPFNNGTFNIYVLNKLTHSSGSTDPIQINVYMTALDDFECFMPDATNFTQVTPMLQPQEGFVPQAGEVEVHENSDNIPTGESDAHDGKDVGLNASAFMHGDPVESFRSLIKRFVLMEDVNISNSGGGTRIWAFERDIYPVFRGVQAGADLDVPGTLHALLASCFLGWRGSMRYKFYPIMVPTSDGSSGISSTIISVSRGNALRQDTGASSANPYFWDRSFSGETITTLVQGQILEFEVPWYAASRMVECFKRTSTTARGLGYRLKAEANTLGTSQQFFVGKIYQAAGDDFSFCVFTGVPTFYINAF